MTDDTSTSDSHWLAGLRASQMDVFDALYVSVVPALYAFAQRFVSADLAEDVVQDVMIGLWERRASLVVHGSLRGYLFGAVRRRVADWRRHDTIVRRHREQVAPLLAIAEPPAAEQATDVAELQSAVDAALATLSDRSRLILSLRWIDGLSYPEIADALGISLAAAKKQGRRLELTLQPLLATLTAD